jgi:hypothetical protein
VQPSEPGSRMKPESSFSLWALALCGGKKTPLDGFRGLQDRLEQRASEQCSATDGSVEKNWRDRNF